MTTSNHALAPRPDGLHFAKQILRVHQITLCEQTTHVIDRLFERECDCLALLRTSA